MATSIKHDIATSLESVGVLDSIERRRLSAISVTTAEELLGIIASDPNRVATYLGISNITATQESLLEAAGPAASASLDSAPDEVFFTGAVPPNSAAGTLSVDPDAFEDWISSGAPMAP